MRSLFHSVLGKTLATGVAAVLVVAGLAVAVPRNGDGAETELDTFLTAAAEATAAVGSADVNVSGDAHTEVELHHLDEFLDGLPDLDSVIDRIEAAIPADVPAAGDETGEPEGSDGSDDSSQESGRPALPALPDAPSVPDLHDLPRLRDLPNVDCDGIPSDVCEQLREGLEDAESRLDSALEQFSAAPGTNGRTGIDEFEDPDAVRDRLRDQMAQRRAELTARMKGHLAEAQDRIAQRLADIPRTFRCDFHFEGSGTLSIPGTVEIGGESDVSCDPDFVDGSGEFHTVISHGVNFTDNGDGTFTASPRGSTLPAAGVHGAAMAELLERADGTDATDHGEEQLDGVTVRHVSFTTEEGPVSISVEAWIGTDDHVVRKLVTKVSGGVDEEGIRAEFRAEHTVLVTNVQVEASSERIDVPDLEDIVPAPPATERLDDLANPFADSIPTPFFGSGSSAS